MKSFGDTEAFGPLGIAPDASNLFAQGSDSLRRLTSLDYADGFGENYTHDAAGQLFRIDGNDSTSVFTYDATGQLVARDAWATDNDGNPYSTPLERYTYDAAGNRSQTGDQTEPNIIGAGNRILSDPTHDYGYDDEGNTVTKTTRATGETWTYTYDHRNRMTAAMLKNVSGATLKSATYTYDVLDRRIAKTVDGAATLFQYNGDTIWSRTDPDGTTQHFLTDGSTDEWLGRTKDIKEGATSGEECGAAVTALTYAALRAETVMYYIAASVITADEINVDDLHDHARKQIEAIDDSKADTTIKIGGLFGAGITSCTGAAF